MKNKEFKPKYSDGYIKYIHAKNRRKAIILFLQIALLISIIGVWELLARFDVIDTFIMSCPSKIANRIVTLFATGNMLHHSLITLYEATLGFIIATVAGTMIAILLWSFENVRKVVEPYIIVLNSLPKIALGPILIIWVGVGTKAILAMDILIMIVITIISMLNAFILVDKDKIMLLKSMGANKWQILTKLILPHSIQEFVSVLKINVGLTWVGTIMGEYLVSKAGLGYLIVYGGQVFDMDLIMSSTIVLCILAALMYFIVAMIEKRILNKNKR